MRPTQKSLIVLPCLGCVTGTTHSCPPATAGQLFDLIDRVDEEMDQARQHMAALGAVRRKVIRVLVEERGARDVAARLGVTRQAVYRNLAIRQPLERAQ